MSAGLDRRLIAAAPAARGLLATTFVLQLCGGVLAVAQAVALATALTDVVHATVPTAPLFALGAAVSGRALVDAAQGWTGARAARHVRVQLRGAVLDAVRRLGPQWAARQPSGRLVTAAATGLESLDGLLARAVPSRLAAALTPPLVVAWLAASDWRSALVIVVLLPLVPLFMALVGLATRRRTERQYVMLARLSGHFLDLVSGLTTLRIYGAAERQAGAVRASTDRYRRQTMATLRSAFLSGLVLDLLATLSIAIVAVEVGLRLDHGSVPLQTALVVLFLVPEAFAPLRLVGTHYHAAEAGRVAVAEALAVVDEAHEAGPLRPPQPDDRCGAVSFEHVSVHYADRARPAVHDVMLRIDPGGTVALNGPSGAGKSTLLAAILGFTSPAAGVVRVGASDPRSSVAWVPQHPRLTQPTVRAEVALGAPAASERDIAAALATCHAPGPAVAITEGARSLSAGQCRRVALARALLRARAGIAAGIVPVVVLDEPSEDLDARTEAVVVAVIAELAGRATVVFATHSDVLTLAADRVVELDAGAVVGDAVQVPIRDAALPHVVHASSPHLPATHGQVATDASRTPALARVRAVAGAGALAGLAGLAGLALTACSVWLICRAAQHPNVQVLALAVVGVRTFALGRALLRYVERLAAHDAALRVLADVRTQVFRALLPLSPGRLRRGDLLRRFVVDVDAVQDGLVSGAVPIMGAAITAAGAITLGMLLVPTAGLALAVGLVVAGLALPTAGRSLAGSDRETAAAASRRDAIVTGYLDGIGELVAYNADERTLDDVRRGEKLVAATSRRADAATASARIATGLTTAVTLGLVLTLGAGAVVTHAITGPAAAVLAACVLAGFDAAATVTPALLAWERLRTSTQRVGEVLAAPAAVAEPTDAAAPASRRLGIAVTDAAIAPAPEHSAVVDGVNLDLAEHARVAIIGPSGCGKSTLLAAVLRLAPVLRGEVAIVDWPCGTRVPVWRVPSSELPPLVAGSLQGDHVFDASLRDNLRVVRPDASDAELDCAARQAGLARFVAELPDGWSTRAGVDGAFLSGGQRQRLLVARALLADPAVLVLDEPTAHLDRATADAVIADVLAGTRGRTVLFSTHRALPAGLIDAIVRLETPAAQDEGPGRFGPSSTASVGDRAAGSYQSDPSDEMEVVA